MEEPREVELKLEMPTDEASVLKRRGLKQLGGGPAKVERLAAVYFDTPKLALRKRGFALRVRSNGSGHIQTVKSANRLRGGLFDRAEWESPVSGREPDPNALAATPAARILRKRGALAPVFETLVDRTTWTVMAGSSTVEVALDQGQVVAGERSHTFAELELELKQGAASDLYDLARKLGQRQHLKVGVVTKSERGYALAAGDAPEAFKAEPIELAPDMTAAEGFRAIAHACFRQFRLNESMVIAVRSVESLHEARVGLRRLRSALSLFKGMIADDRVGSLEAQLKEVSRTLGQARNLDVYLERYVTPDVADHPAEPGIDEFVAHVRAMREEACDAVVAALGDAKFGRITLDLLAWIEGGPWCTEPDPARVAARNRPMRDTAGDILDTAYRKVRKKGRKLAEVDPPARHRVRIAAKKLRYAAEFFAALNGGKAERRRYDSFVKSLKRFQEQLGDLNDVATGHQLAEDLAASAKANGAGLRQELFAAGHLAGGQDARTEPLLKSAVKAYSHVTRAPRFWRSW